jgi:hypothetical protein
MDEDTAPHSVGCRSDDRSSVRPPEALACSHGPEPVRRAVARQTAPVQEPYAPVPQNEQAVLGAPPDVLRVPVVLAVSYRG